MRDRLTGNSTLNAAEDGGTNSESKMEWSISGRGLSIKMFFKAVVSAQILAQKRRLGKAQGVEAQEIGGTPTRQGLEGRGKRKARGAGSHANTKRLKYTLWVPSLILLTTFR